MELLDIPLEAIRVPDVRITSHMPEELLAEFRGSVQTAGVIEPAYCIRENGTIWLVNGLHRLQEASVRGDPTLRCAVRDGTLREAILHNLVTSGLHGRPRVQEVRQVIRYLEETEGMDSVALRRAIGLSQSYIENLQWTNRSLPAVQQALDDEIISVGHAVILAHIDDQAVQERVLYACLDNRMSIAALREHVSLVQRIMSGELAPAEPPPPPEPALVRCHYCRGESDPAHAQQVTVCPTCYDFAWRAIRAAQAVAAAGGGA